MASGNPYRLAVLRVCRSGTSLLLPSFSTGGAQRFAPPTLWGSPGSIVGIRTHAGPNGRYEDSSGIASRARANRGGYYEPRTIGQWQRSATWPAASLVEPRRLRCRRRQQPNFKPAQPLLKHTHQATAPITRRTRAVRRRRPRSSATSFRRSAICSGDASGPNSTRTARTRAARSMSALHSRQRPER